VNVWGADSTSDTGFATLSGTSQATPLVSGIIAAMLAAAPDASFMEVRSARNEPGLLILSQIVLRLRSYNAVFAGLCGHVFGYNSAALCLSCARCPGLHALLVYMQEGAP
jgi:hypothetical protein